MSDHSAKNPLPEICLELKKAEFSSRSLGLEFLEPNITLEIRTKVPTTRDIWETPTLKIRDWMVMFEHPGNCVYSLNVTLVDSFRDTLIKLLERLETEDCITRYFLIL